MTKFLHQMLSRRARLPRSWTFRIGAGYAYSVDNDFAAARLNVDGTPDTGFGGDGATTIDLGGPVDFAYAVALQSDGKLVLAGRAGDQSSVDVGLARLQANGQIDNDYGDDGNGRVRSDVTAGSWDEAADMVMLPDDSIVVAVQAAFGSAFNYTVVRYSVGGEVGGPADIVHTPIGPLSDYSRALALAPDGKLIVAGQVSSGTVDDFGIVRYNADLTLDASFAGGGVLLVDFFGASDGASDVALQPDGKIVVVGVARNGTTTGLGLLRANP